MKIINLIAAILLASSAVASAASKETKPLEQQVLMTIDGTPVTAGEFLYLYNKNNQQQSTPQSVGDYLELFTNYKLKVAEAQRAGLDTTAAFINELQGYARDLAQPYLEDKGIKDSLLHQAYDHMQREIEVQHLMLATQQGREMLDSLRTLIAGGADFADLARKYSVDRSSAASGGMMGYVTAGRFPWAFEQAVYTTPEGELSEVFSTPYGFHLVKVLSSRPSKGAVLVQHILKVTRNASEAEAEAKRQAMDSIHALLLAGADFDEIATRESEDPGSARQGGRLPWFGTGQMVKPFEEVSFTLADGQISDVFATSYGYHIVKKLGEKGVPTYEESLQQLNEELNHDERGDMPRRAVIERMAASRHLMDNRPAFAMVESVIRSHGGLDSAAYSALLQTPAPVITYDGGAVRVNDVLARIAPMGGTAPVEAYNIFRSHARALADEAMLDLAVAELPANNDDYRNLLNEYRDGILLFEISDRNVWNRAKEDTAGLDKWFEEHRSDYAWSSPKFKSYIIFATSDSILQQAHAYLEGNPVEPEALSSTLRQHFGKNIRVEKVLGARGENAIVDYLGFEGPKPAPTGKWIAYEAYRPVVIDAPQGVADVRSAVTSDYQNHLEQQWLKEIKSRHKVKVDKKVLKRLQ